MKSRSAKKRIKTFEFSGDPFQQSLVNHEHPNQFLIPLERKKPDFVKARMLFQEFVSEWFEQMKTYKEHYEKGFTFFMAIDAYQICMVSVVAGQHDAPIYGGKPKVFRTMDAIMKQFHREFQAFKLLQKKSRYIGNALIRTQGQIPQVANELGVKASDLKTFIEREFDLSRLEGQMPSKNYERLKNNAVRPFSYAVYLQKSSPGQTQLILK